ncbi:uncharacterized protein BX663DRAFT_495420 [Cokeromyces recurvatus]|uniref:uncharacterized protein n=1 Tax=Cokeromyces recurvatus TaxID=90255 RepID=UPI00221E62D2|nr:uncharacterized protein BX663DRAFT_495420 [Cokeromyces recurvatus]KAI7907286.1 hypothetical protein BX663DRAFT_495420 [Cokeromyces recurvatus]
MLPLFNNCPATCELCGQWMPGHSSDCPRSGVHPSQWSSLNLKKNLNDNEGDTIYDNYALLTFSCWSSHYVREFLSDIEQ